MGLFLYISVGSGCIAGLCPTCCCCQYPGPTWTGPIEERGWEVMNMPQLRLG